MRHLGHQFSAFSYFAKRFVDLVFRKQNEGFCARAVDSSLGWVPVAKPLPCEIIFPAPRSLKSCRREDQFFAKIRRRYRTH